MGGVAIDGRAPAPGRLLRDLLDTLRRVLRIGLPATGENLSYWSALIVTTSFASRMGEGSVAAFAYSRQMTRWVLLFSGSIGLATEILVGHLVGAGEIERAYRELTIRHAEQSRAQVGRGDESRDAST